MAQKQAKDTNSNNKEGAETKEGSETTVDDATSFTVYSFKDLHTVLAKNEMNKVQRMRFMKKIHRKATKQMCAFIQREAKDSSKYAIMSKMAEIKSLRAEVKDDDDHRALENETFSNKLDLKYDEWILNKQENEAKFKEEIASILKVDASKIEIKKTERGSVVILIVVGVCVLAACALVGIALSHSGPRIPIDYNMRPDDQIEVKYKGNWYPATVISVWQDANKPGKTFKVRYNPVNGENIFWRNTETFNEMQQSTRLHLPNRKFIEINGNIVQQHIVWQPPPLCNVSKANGFNALLPKDHIFMKKKNMWSRCEVVAIRRTHQGISVKVVGLIDNEFKTWYLWKGADIARLSLNDERP